MKMTIYKCNNVWCITPDENYNARIQNARQIKRIEWATSPQEIIEYYIKHFNSSESDFTIIE